MKKLILNFVLILSFSFSLLPQKKSETPKMIYWIGGKMNLNYSQGVNMSVGTGQGNGIFAGIISPNLNNGATSLISNPAELAYLKKANMMVETKLGLGITDAIAQKDLKTQTDNTLKDTSTFVFTSGNYRRDTEIGSQEVAQLGGLASLTGAIPIENYFVLGGGYNTPLDITLELLVNGLATDLASTKKVGDNETKIDIILKPTILSLSKIKVTRISYGIAKEIFNSEKGQFAVGLAINRFDVRQLYNMNLDFQGMVVLNNTNEYYFNDPNDQNIDASKNESNKLFMRAKGDYKDTRVGFTLGTNYNPANLKNWLSNFNFSLVFTYNPNMNLLDENAFSESYQPKFMKGRYGGKNEEKFDIVIDSFDLAKPNLTVTTNNYFTKEVFLKFPSNITFGIDWKVGVHNFSLNVIKYFGELSYQFDKYKIGKEMSVGIKGGVDLKFPEELKGWAWALVPLRLLTADVDGLLMQAFRKWTKYENPHYRGFGGLSLGTAKVSGFDDKENEKMFKSVMDLPIPLEFGISRSYRILNNIDVGVMVFSFPDLFMRFSFAYNI